MHSIHEFIDKRREEMIKTLQTLIRIPSHKQPAQTHAPFGSSCAQALDFALAAAQDLGFETHNLDHYIGYVDYGQGAECFGVLTHLDVVPEGSGWDHPPYDAVIADNRLYGRGTSDDKGPAVAALYALAAVKASGLTLKRRVRLIFGCDEESGWQDIAHYKKFEPLPDIAISPDGDYPVVNAEKGILHLTIESQYPQQENPQAYVASLRGGTAANVIPGEAEAFVFGIAPAIIDIECERIAQYNNIRFEYKGDAQSGIHIHCFGKGGHASTPEEGANAICALLELLARLPLDDSSANQHIKKLSNLFPIHDPNGKASAIDMHDEKSGHLTCSLDMIELGLSSGEALLDIRYPISQTPERIIKILSDQDLQVSISSHSAPHYVDPESELVQTLLRVYEEETGNEGYCLAIGGGTYARAIENAVTFGCQFPGTTALMHQPNESIDLDELVLNAKIIAHAIVEICT